MKIVAVYPNNRKRVFELRTRRHTLLFPYSECDPAPSRSDPIQEAFVDPELGNEAFTYSLESGGEGSVHIDDVLEYNKDPAQMADIALYLVSTKARRMFESSPLSAREIARRMDTSPAQLYRLLDPTNYAKSFRQMLSLLYVMGYEVELELKAIHPDKRPRKELKLQDIQRRLKESFDDLRRREPDLLEFAVGERAVVAKLACYVAEQFPRHHVDVEYNRHGLDPKRLGWSDVAGRIFPDLIVHHRGNDRSNLVVIEVKRESNSVSRARDLVKLQGLMNEYEYRWGALLELPSGSGARTRQEHWNWVDRSVAFDSASTNEPAL